MLCIQAPTIDKMHIIDSDILTKPFYFRLQFKSQANNGDATNGYLITAGSEQQTSESQLFRCFRYSDVCYSYPHCTMSLRHYQVPQVVQIYTISGDKNTIIIQYCNGKKVSNHKLVKVTLLMRVSSGLGVRSWPFSHFGRKGI